VFDLNGQDWEVMLVSPGHRYLTRSDGSVALGMCDNVTKTIYLDDTLDPALMHKVLTHEVAHAAMFSYDVELSCCQEEVVAILIDTFGPPARVRVKP
jgi:hypothetical protein